MEFREYDGAKDREAVHRIWNEIGWIEPDKERQHKALDWTLEASHGSVAILEGEAECAVTSASGVLRYLEEDLSFSAVTAVTTSRVARQQGLAMRLLAQHMAEDAAEGALVSGLGIFDQGFYNKAGYGNGAYGRWVALDPAQLDVPGGFRPPKRLTVDDWEATHAARLNRRRGHGSVCLTEAALTRAEMAWGDKSFGLGYGDGLQGALSHLLWIGTDNVGSGPYQVFWMAYQTVEQFRELMALLASFGDQTKLVRLQEPPGIQVQDLLKRPFRHRELTEKSKFETGIHCAAYWQMRICDLSGCLERTHLPGPDVRFNLNLRDPIEKYLEADAPWHGVDGEYTVMAGPTSTAEPGHRADLPLLETSVNAFTRLWLGIRPATGLAFTDDLKGPPDLLEALDAVFRLSPPETDWGF